MKLRSNYLNLQYYISQMIEKSSNCFQKLAKQQKVQHYTKFEMILPKQLVLQVKGYTYNSEFVNHGIRPVRLMCKFQSI